MKNSAAPYSQLDPVQRRIGKLLGLLPGMHHHPPFLVRKIFSTFDRLAGLKKQSLFKVSNYDIPVSGSQTIKTRVYYPTADATNAMVYFHGGGCVIGNIETHDRFCRLLANESDTVIISVDYRLSPEEKFPVALNDAIDSWNWVLDNTEMLNVDRDNIGTGGDSAGAYLATILSLSENQPDLINSTSQKPAYQWLLYPLADLRGQDSSYQFYGENVLLTSKMMTYFRGHFLNSEDEKQNPIVSLVLSDKLHECPKTCLISAQFDPLYDSNIVLVEALKNAQVQVTHKHLEDCFHGFISVAGISKRANQACIDIARCLVDLKDQ